MLSAFAQDISQLSIMTILRSPVTIWSHGAYINRESEQLQGGHPGKDPESRVAAKLLCN